MIQFTLVETIATGLMDRFPKPFTQRHKSFIYFALCLCFFLFGLILCTKVSSLIAKLMVSVIFVKYVNCIEVTSVLIAVDRQGGVFVLKWMEFFAGNWAVMALGVWECVAVAWVYGN